MKIKLTKSSKVNNTYILKTHKKISSDNSYTNHTLVNEFDSEVNIKNDVVFKNVNFDKNTSVNQRVKLAKELLIDLIGKVEFENLKKQFLEEQKRAK